MIKTKYLISFSPETISGFFFSIFGGMDEGWVCTVYLRGCADVRVYGVNENWGKKERG
jgi:hypothetical protein